MHSTTSAIRNNLTPIGVLILAAAVAIAAFFVTSTAHAASGPYTSSLGLTRVAVVKVATSGSGTTAAMSTVSTRVSVPLATASSKVRYAAAHRSAIAASGTGEDAKARSILSSLIAAHPILAGTTVEFGDARGYQAISYYQSGRIVISASHSATLERILNHEIWHIIDWRDNGRIDWGENVPPK